MRLRVYAGILLMHLGFVTPAAATGEIVDIITLHDQLRLMNHTAARKEAIAAAKAGGSPADLKVFDRLVNSLHISMEGFDLSGEWQCRTIKAGGLADLVVYSWFKCRVTDDGSGWRLQKLTGSQRTTGRFFTAADNRLVYLGSGTVNNDKPLPYGSGVESDEAGYAFRIGRNSWLIEFPYPHYESSLDILEMRR